MNAQRRPGRLFDIDSVVKEEAVGGRTEVRTLVSGARPEEVLNALSY
jgi:hypothetical protein